MDDNGITGPDWGRSEGGAQRFVNGKVSAFPSLSVDAVKAAVPRQSFTMQFYRIIMHGGGFVNLFM